MGKTTEIEKYHMSDEMAGRLIDLTDCVEFIEKSGNLIRVKSEVDSEYELAGIAYKYHESHKSVLFERVKGSEFPVVCGLLGNRDVVADAFGIPKEDLPLFMSGAVEQWHKDQNKFPSEVLEKGPANEVIEEDVDLFKLPIPIHAMKDGGRYFDASVMVVKNPETGIPNISLRRFMVTGQDRMTLQIDPGRHLGAYLEITDKRNEPLPITLNTGMGFAVWFAATFSKQGDGKTGIASHMIRRPIPFIKANSVDAPAFAHAQFVIEGEILPDTREDEGPFAEVTDYYSRREKKRVLKVRGITRRKRPIFHTLLGRIESVVATGFSGEGQILDAVKKQVPQLKAVYLTPGGGGHYQAIVQVDTNREGLGRKAILETFKAYPSLMWVVTVDTDVDLYDEVDVDWAISTRFNAANDLILLENQSGHVLNPMVTPDPDGKGGTVAKMGIDATAPFERKEELQRVTYMDVDLKKYDIVEP